MPTLAMLATLLGLVPLGGGCSSDCCTLDGFPIAIARAPLGTLTPNAPGALLVDAAGGSGGGRFKMLLDTGSPLTLFASGDTQDLKVASRSFQLYDANPAAAERARFGGISSLQLPLHPVGTADLALGGVLGADILGAFSVELRLNRPCTIGGGTDGGAGSDGGAVPASTATCPTVTFWNHQGASDGFLADAGFAVIPFSPYGGGELSATDRDDFVGLSGPLHVGPSRIVVRTCAAPRPFSRDEAVETCCTAREATEKASGVDLALLVATGVGPLVLSTSAWQRLAARIDPAMIGGMTSAPLLLGTWPTPIDATWTTIPRLAVVNMETDASTDPGPCVELGRSRRLEWVAYRQSQSSDEAACAQPCDTDTHDPGKAQNSAAYVEIGNSIPVAIISDDDRWLQGLRLDIRPEGPEVDGVLGAGALGPAQIEFDYQSSTRRLIFSCDGADRDACWAASRCARLPDQAQKHVCFGLGRHGLPQKCVPSGCPVQ